MTTNEAAAIAAKLSQGDRPWEVDRRGDHVRLPSPIGWPLGG
jgi:hypothetical protein